MTGPSHVSALAAKFGELLRRDLGEHYDAAVEANRAAPADAGYCASHDYIDANMTMAEAFEAVVGREVDIDDDDDCAIWSAAWDEWKQTSEAAR